MRLQKSFGKYAIMFVCFLMVGFLACGPFATPTEAAVAGCRSDPLVTLSDGTILDLTADIGTSVSNVTEIHYTVHGPKGVRLITAVRTPTLGFSGKETFTYYDDAQPKQYITKILVQTRVNNVQVVSHSTFVNLSLFSQISLSLQYAAVYGYNNQILTKVLTR